MYLSHIPTQNKIIPVNDKFCEGVEGRQELAEKCRPGAAFRLVFT